MLINGFPGSRFSGNPFFVLTFKRFFLPSPSPSTLLKFVFVSASVFIAGV